LAERLARGEAAPRGVSIYDMFLADPRYDCGPYSGVGGWEIAEKRSVNAIRSGAEFLNDYAIARRLPERELRKKGWAEAQAEWKARAEKNRVRQAEEDAAAEEARRAWEARRTAAEKAEAERRALWETEQRRRNLEMKWQCTCGSPAKIEEEGAGYWLTCLACGKNAYSSFESISNAKIR
jgi:hypothetical protein